MKKNNFVLLIAGLLAGALIGYLAAKGRYEAGPGTIRLDPNMIQYFEPTSMDNAHTMSVRFRNRAGICADTSTAGIFEFSEKTARDLVLAIDSIKRQVLRATNATPAFYRGVFGIDSTGNNRLIIAGLNQQNREFALFTKIIDGHLPCPTMCDINLSDIIMGTGTNRHPCQ